MNPISKYTDDEITAFQLPALRASRSPEPRAQLWAALKDFEIPSFGYNQGRNSFDFHLPDGSTVSGVAGDFLVKRDSGRVEVVSADVFAEDYELKTEAESE